jgi:phospholipid/cholesterol/gamma-HCH transport system substrate-binding protein
MRTEIPRLRLTAFAFAAAAAIGLFLYLNVTFGGPTLIPGGATAYELHASFPDSQNIVKQSLVMYRGFQVGNVDDVRIARGRALVTFTIDGRYAPLPRGTIAQIDHRTFLQEAFVNISVPPTPLGGATLRTGSAVRSIATVEPDDALQVFDPQTRKLLDQGTSALAGGLRAPNAADEIGGTISGLDGVLVGLHGVFGALQGQESQISSLVTGSATVLGAIATEQQQLAELIGSGRTVAQTFAAEHQAFGTGLDQLNGLLGDTRAVLPALRPLLAAATGVLGRAATTAGELTPAVDALGPAVTDARQTALALDPSARAAAPALIQTLAAARALGPTARRLGPAIANLVPLMGYVAQHISGFESLIGNLAATVDHGDSRGPWLQGFLDVTTGGVLGGDAPCRSTIGLCANPYPKAGDAVNPQPYAPGDFPRLKPYFPSG